VETLNMELNQENVQEIVGNSQVVVDALDNLTARIITSRYVFNERIPFVHGAIHGTMGQLSTFTHETPSYENTFKLSSRGKELSEDVLKEVEAISQSAPPVIGPVPNIVGCLQAFEVIKILTGRGEVITAPDVMIFDLMKNEPFTVVKY